MRRTLRLPKARSLGSRLWRISPDSRLLARERLRSCLITDKIRSIESRLLRVSEPPAPKLSSPKSSYRQWSGPAGLQHQGVCATQHFDEMQLRIVACFKK